MPAGGFVFVVCGFFFTALAFVFVLMTIRQQTGQEFLWFVCGGNMDTLCNDSPPCSSSMYSNGLSMCENLHDQIKVEPDFHCPSDGNGYLPPIRPDHFPQSCRSHYNGHNPQMEYMRPNHSSSCYMDGRPPCPKMSPHYSGESPPSYSSHSNYGNSMQNSLSCVFGMQRPRKVI